jgi:hypothetical protein
MSLLDLTCRLVAGSILLALLVGCAAGTMSPSVPTAPTSSVVGSAASDVTPASETASGLEGIVLRQAPAGSRGHDL